MEIDVLQLLVYGGPSAVLLGVLLIWYLPMKDKRHSETIKRIHNEDHGVLAAEIATNSRCVQQLARAVLVAELTRQGAELSSAELTAQRIIANGGP